jgi:hypothetical protein
MQDTRNPGGRRHLDKALLLKKITEISVSDDAATPDVESRTRADFPETQTETTTGLSRNVPIVKE